MTALATRPVAPAWPNLPPSRPAYVRPGAVRDVDDEPDLPPDCEIERQLDAAEDRYIRMMTGEYGEL